MNIYSHFSANGIKLEPSPFTSESAMAGYLADNPNILKLYDTPNEDGIQIIGIEKQWKKSGENRGRIDFLVSYGDSTYAVVELKKNELTSESFDQLKSYFDNENHLKAVSDSLSDSFELDSKEASKFQWMGVLVGNGINDKLKAEIEEYNSNNTNKPFAVIILNRYKSDNQIFTLADIAVPPKKGKDHSEFEFKGINYKKGRLVLAMIKSYAEENYGKLTASELIRLIGSYPGKPILWDYDDAVEDSKRLNKKGNAYRYYFIKPNEAIMFNDGTKLAVLDWWTKNDIPVIEKIAKALGCEYKKL